MEVCKEPHFSIPTLIRFDGLHSKFFLNPSRSSWPHDHSLLGNLQIHISKIQSWLPSLGLLCLSIISSSRISCFKNSNCKDNLITVALSVPWCRVSWHHCRWSQFMVDIWSAGRRLWYVCGRTVGQHCCRFGWPYAKLSGAGTSPQEQGKERFDWSIREWLFVIVFQLSNVNDFFQLTGIFNEPSNPSRSKNWW